MQTNLPRLERTTRESVVHLSPARWEHRVTLVPAGITTGFAQRDAPSPLAERQGGTSQAPRLPELVSDGQNQRTERETEEEHIAIGTGKCVIFIELIRLCAFEIIGKVMLCLPEQYTYSLYCDSQLNT